MLVKLSPGVNFIIVLSKADPKVAKKYSQAVSLFCAFGIIATCKKLVTFKLFLLFTWRIVACYVGVQMLRVKELEVVPFHHNMMQLTQVQNKTW